MRLSWSIEGEEQLVRNLKDIGQGVKDWMPAFKEASDKLLKVFSDDVFRTQGGAIQEKWNPLKPKYLAQKVKSGYPADALVKTGRMKSNFQSIVKTDRAEIWNSTQYFKYHQSAAPRNKLPRRVMMKLGNSQKEIVVKIFHTYWYKKTHGKSI
jgi:phage gpG-like protein